MMMFVLSCVKTTNLLNILSYFKVIKKRPANRFAKKTLDFYKKVIFFHINYALHIKDFFAIVIHYEMSIL